MNFISGRNTPAFAKDTVYRFMKMIQINWIRFTTILAGRIIKEAIRPLDSEERVNVLIITAPIVSQGISGLKGKQVRRSLQRNVRKFID